MICRPCKGRVEKPPRRRPASRRKREKKKNPEENQRLRSDRTNAEEERSLPTRFGGGMWYSGRGEKARRSLEALGVKSFSKKARREKDPTVCESTTSSFTGKTGLCQPEKG